MGIFSKSPAKKTQKAYEQKLKEAMEAQRNGDIQLFATLSSEAEVLFEKVRELSGKGSD